MTTESEAPSPDEVRRYVDSLYDRAESDTGRFNATRAAGIPRQRDATTRDRSREDAEPAFGGFARQWFDAARAKLGPTVPASLPERGLPAVPDRAPRATRPARPVERPAEPLALEAPRTPKVPGVPASGAWQLTGGTAQTPPTAALPQLSGRPVAPGAAGESRRDESAWRADAQPAASADAVAPWPVYEREPSPALDPGPELAPQLAAALPTGPDPTAAYRTVLPGVPAPAATALAPAPPTEPTGTPVLAVPAAAAMPATQDTSPAWEAAATGTPVLAVPTAAAMPATQDTSPAWETTSTTVTSATYGGSWQSPDAAHRTQAERVIAFARAQIGRPCVWGAVGPGSYDAPGLTQAAWKAAGVTLPRTAEAQWRAGMQVTLADVQVGDLVFFHDDLRHVGICSGDGMMIHAPGPGARIGEESVFYAGQSAIKGVIRPA
ncbi:NlpC/P60 family protein [Streptomyces massasporeus]|uniref:C40 family peptidase n=1 Tax=Streptomyces massasporeus TaxID=67324 RepID=UPI0037FDAD46